MYHRLYVHIVWTTRRREPMLDVQAAAFLAAFLPAVAAQERCRVIGLGVVRTHLHLLVQLHPTTNLPRLVQRLKGGSSVISNRDGHGRMVLRWAKGYSVTSVGPRSLDAARRYVTAQSEHHPDEAIAGWDGWEMPASQPIAPTSKLAARRLSLKRRGAVAASAAGPSRGFSRGAER